MDSLTSEETISALIKCPCGLPTAPPEGVDWWRPDLDLDPGPPLFVVVRYGEDPEVRRAVRLGNDAGWAEYGWRVNLFADITPPLLWARVGLCWADTPHPVIAVCQDRDGAWSMLGQH